MPSAVAALAEHGGVGGRRDWNIGLMEAIMKDSPVEKRGRIGRGRAGSGRTLALGWVLSLAACGPGSMDTESGSGGMTGTAETGSGSTPTEANESGSSTVPTTGAETGSSTVPTTGAETGTGGQTCEPSGGPIAEAQFASRFAEAVCAQKEACACDVAPDCVASFAAKFAAVQQHAMDNGLHYDEACAGDTLVDAVEGRGCGMYSEFYDNFGCTDRGEINCFVFRGDVASGEACPNFPPEVSAYSEPCADAGEYCHFSDTVFCGPPQELPTVGSGEACLSPEHNVIAACAAGTECNAFTGRCDEPAGEGEPCGGDQSVQCAGLLWCDAEGTCQAQKPDGATCMDFSECESRACEGGVCVDFVILCRVDAPADLLYSFGF